MAASRSTIREVDSEPTPSNVHIEPVRLDTTSDGWVIHTGMRFYIAAYRCWGTVGKPAYRDPNQFEQTMVAARYWDVALDDGRRLAVTGCHLLCHEPADVVAWWDRHLCPDAESITEFHRTGITREDKMRADYPPICAALAEYKRILRRQLPKLARDYYRDQIESANGRAEWIERTFRVRGLPLLARRA